MIQRFRLRAQVISQRLDQKPRWQSRLCCELWRRETEESHRLRLAPYGASTGRLISSFALSPGICKTLTRRYAGWRSFTFVRWVLQLRRLVVSSNNNWGTDLIKSGWKQKKH